MRERVIELLACEMNSSAIGSHVSCRTFQATWMYVYGGIEVCFNILNYRMLLKSFKALNQGWTSNDTHEIS